MTLQDARLFEQPDCAIDRGDADPGINLDGTLVHGLDIGMIDGLRQHACDHTALLSHLEPLVYANPFEMRHHASSMPDSC